jgi:hypothetical protein
LPARLAMRGRAFLFTARHSVRSVMNCHPLSPLVCIASACFACAAGAQSVSADTAAAPAFASSAPLASVRPQRSAQPSPADPTAAATAATATTTATAASGVDAPRAALAQTRVAPDADSRARSKLRRPLVPGRPSRPRVAEMPVDDPWRSDTLYASPYATSPYAHAGDPD